MSPRPPASVPPASVPPASVPSASVAPSAPPARRDALPARGRVFVGAAHVGSGLLVAYVAFRTLPARVPVVDAGAALAAALLVVSGVLLLARHRLAAPAARIASGVVLAVGLGAITVLVGALSALRAAYGSLAGGALPLVIVAGSIPVAYLVLLPAASLLWLGPRREAPRA